MKHLLFIITVLLTLVTSAASAQMQHKQRALVAVTIQPKGLLSAGVDAVSDTTSCDSDAVQDSLSAASFYNHWGNNDRDTQCLLESMFKGLGMAGGAISIVFIFLVFLLFALPFIVAIVAIYYASQKRKVRMQLLEKAIESGQPLPDEYKSKLEQSNEYLRKRGIRNVALGIGLAFLFYFLNMYSFIGVGALVACMGGGQMWMAKPSNKENDNEEQQ